MNDIVFYALLATLGTWLVTALGAATVVLFKSPNPKILNLMLGFAAGVMIAASFWSLLQPAIERAEAAGSMPAFLVATLGFLCGALFMWGSDKCVTYAQRRSALAQGEKNARLNRIILLVLSITLHNIPEGMAVGVMYAGFLAGGTQITAASALALSIGIAIQNFPEGAIISMPLRAEGQKKGRAFLGGVLSGVVEPAGAVLTILAAQFIIPALPYLLSFAAGAMLYVVVEELIPELSQGAHSNLGTVFFAVGFSVMMVLDVALG